MSLLHAFLTEKEKISPDLTYHNFRVLLCAETATGRPGGRPAVGNSLQFPSRFPSRGCGQTNKFN